MKIDRDAIKQALGSEDEELERRVTERLNPSSKQRQDTEEGSLYKRAEYINQEAVQGVANALGFPVDIVSAGLEALGVDTGTPVGGSDHIMNTLNKVFGVGGKEAQDATDRILGTIAREAMSAASLGGPLIAAGRKVGGNKFLDAFRKYTEPMAKSPGKAIAVETGLGASGGAGLALTEESTDNPYAHMAGYIAGGLAPSGVARAARGVGDSAVSLVRGISKEKISNRAEERVADTLGRVTTSRVHTLGNIDKALKEGLEGAPVTTATASKDPGLQELERMAARDRIELSSTLKQSETDANTVFNDRLASMAPRGNPDLVGPEVKVRVDRLKGALESRLEAARQAVRERVSELSTSDKNSASLIAREELQKAAEEGNQLIDQLYSALPQNIPVSAIPVQKAASNLVKNTKMIEGTEGLPTQLLTDLKDLLKNYAGRDRSGRLKIEIPFGEMKALRTRINSELQKATNPLNPNRRLAGNLMKLRDATDESIDFLGYSMNKDVATAYNTARQVAREHYKLFREGVNARVLQKGQLGEPSRIPESSTLNQYFKADTQRGAKESIDQYLASVGNRTEALGALKEHARNVALSGSRIRQDGSINTNSLNIWMRNHSTALSRLPDVKQELDTLIDLQRKADRYGVRVDRLSKSSIQRSVLGKVMNGDPESAIEGLLKSNSQRKDVTRVMRALSPDAQEGLRRYLWDNMLSKSQTGRVDLNNSPIHSPVEAKEYIKANRGAFEAAFGKEHLDNVEKILNRAEHTQRQSAVPTARAEYPNKESSLPLSVNQIMSRFWGVARNVVSMRYVMGDIGIRAYNNYIDKLSEQEMRVLLNEALVNPEVAKTLLTKVHKGNAKEQRRKLRLYLLQAGMQPLEEDDAQDD